MFDAAVADADPELRELEAAMADPGPDLADQAIGTPDHAPSWDDFTESWDLFAGDAVTAAAISGTVLGFLSVYIVLRRMVFLSAAVSQSAGLGVALAFYLGFQLGISIDPVLGATVMSLATAALLSRDFARWGLSREMILGLAFALASGAAVLVASSIPNDAHDIQVTLFGSAVVVDGDDLRNLFVGGGFVMALHIWWFRGFSFASFDPTAARVQEVPVGLLDLILLLSIGVMIALATRALGAMPAFAMSTLPGVAALLVARGRLIVPFLCAAVFGATAGVLGYVMSFFLELPVGPSQTVVAVGIVLVCAVVRIGMTLIQAKR